MHALLTAWNGLRLRPGRALASSGSGDGTQTMAPETPSRPSSRRLAYLGGALPAPRHHVAPADAFALLLISWAFVEVTYLPERLFALAPSFGDADHGSKHSSRRSRKIKTLQSRGGA